MGIDAFPIEEVIARGEKTYQDMLRQGEEGVEVDEALFQRAEGEHEQLVEMIRSLILDERKTFSVNIPNEGAVKGLPDDAVLEIPGVAAGVGFCPMRLTGFSDELKGIIARRLAPVNPTVTAALTGSRDMWVEAMLLDGAVADVRTARALAEDFLAEYRDCLPQYFS